MLLRPIVLVLALGSLPPLAARADEPTKALRVPPAPSQYLVDTLAELKAALPAELLPSFAVVVADARLRLAASERAAAEGDGERISVADACRAALVDADFAGASKRKGKQLDALVQLTALQLGVDLHVALRERVGRQLAIRAVRACNDASACLDAIAPTSEMTADHVATVRKQFEGKGKELESADRLGNFEIQQLTATYQSTMARVKTSDKMQKAVLDFVKG
ncbi:MAG TPA: hypothetical protein VG755_28840 [Nannocystaceae bacterium]|nr:hypothetical protein [Nannocystaceae bacterium]